MPARQEQHGYAEALRAARYLGRRSKPFPRVGIVLGSGFDTLSTHFAASVTIPYSHIPHFPRPAVEGHAGRLHLGRLEDIPVVVLDGRVHFYEGYTPAEVAFAVRVLGLTGVDTLVIACAAGGVARAAAVGSLMVFSDHLNFLGSSPLAGPHDEHWGERFVEMSGAYDARLRRAAVEAAASLHLKCFEGVYAAVPGPQFETPAEIRVLRRLGADAVGMSTVPEVIAARQLNMRVLAIALISNRAAALAREPLRHKAVLAAGNCSAKDLARLLALVLKTSRRLRHL